MTIEIIIDCRERKLIEELKKLNVNISIEQLDLGDIVFKKDGKIIFIIERKTWMDLKASICDGRNKEQKLRLLGSGIGSQRILYLVEGKINNSKIRNFPITTLIGSIINTQLRDNIKFYRTISIKESAQFIQLLQKKFEKQLEDFFPLQTKKISEVEYASSLKKKKKSNMNSKVWFISQLSLIPSISEKIAGIIVEKFQSPFDLLESYKKLETSVEKEELLSNITYSIKNGTKTRRIGKVISSKIYNYMHGKCKATTTF